jgi:C4-type Zn-finger protein
MEVFKVNHCDEEGIDLKSGSQLESLLNQIKDSVEVMIKWEEEDEDGHTQNKSEILLTDNLMARIKDGRFRLTSSTEKEE